MNETLVVLVRSLMTFFILLIYARIIGKQQIGNLTMFDYINGITIGSIAATMATDLSSKVLVHWVALTVFIALTLVMQFTYIKNRYLAKVINSEPVTMVQAGKILEENLAKVRISIDELMTQLRSKSFFDITEVEIAILEPDGSLSVLPKAEFRTVIRKDLLIKATPAKLTTEVILDGIMIENNLTQRNKDQAWLELQLKNNGIRDIKEVAYAAILPNDKLYVDRYQDNISKEADISDYDGLF